eukprot:s3962_g8.t1
MPPRGQGCRDSDNWETVLSSVAESRFAYCSSFGKDAAATSACAISSTHVIRKISRDPPINCRMEKQSWTACYLALPVSGIIEMGVCTYAWSLDACKSGILVLEITKSRDLETSQSTCGLRVPPVQPWEKACSLCPTKADVCSLACASTPFNDSKSTIPWRSSLHALQISDPGRFLKPIFCLKCLRPRA